MSSIVAIPRSTLLSWLGRGLLAALVVGGCECEEGRPPLGRVAPDLYTETTEIDFGNVPIGAAKDSPVSIENRGDALLVVCAAAPRDGATAEAHCAELSGPTPAEAPFGVVFDTTLDTGGWSVDTTAARELIVRFTPTGEGGVEAVVRIIHNGRSGPAHEIRVRGNGVKPQIDLSTQVLDFGEVTVGQRKLIDVTLTNRTEFAQPVRVGPIDQAELVFGTTSMSGEARPGQPLVVDVPGNGSATFQAWFGPIREGQAMNNLVVAICPADSCKQTILMLGQGVKPTFALEPAALDFGRLDEGQTRTLNFVVRNVGLSALTVQGAELEAGTSSEFSVTPSNGLPATLRPQETFRFDVTYAGQTPGADMGRVLVTTNAYDDPNTGTDERIGAVTLRAELTGPDIAALPAAVNFGTVAITTGMASRNLVLENQGNSPLTITQIQLNGPTSEITTTSVPSLPAVVQPGASVTVGLQYAPTNGGLDEAQVVVISDDRDEGSLVVPVGGIGGVPTSCAVSTAPTMINFGVVERGRRAQLPVDVRNTGAMPCNVSNIRVSGAPEFGALSTMNLTVPPGGTQRIDLTYAPTMYGNHTGTLEFDADDPTRATVQVPIVGLSQMSNVRVIPAEVNFGTVPVTCGSQRRVVNIYNTGATQVQVRSVRLDPSSSPEFELCVQGSPIAAWCTAPFNTPTTIPAGGQVAFELRYRPQDIGADTGVVFIEHSAAPAPVALPIQGRGELSAQVTETFQQVPTPQADVLFVVDNSCSMSEEQASLGSNLSSFLTLAQSQGVDYHIAVTTTDVVRERGAFVGSPRYITPMTANAETTFRNTVTNGTRGTNGSSDEQGLEAAYLALTDPNLSGANAGFLRADAALAVIVVSDEEDSSPRADNFYINFFRSLKPSNPTVPVQFSAVVKESDRCTSAATIGSRYISVAQATGGLVESICTANWGQTLGNIGLATFGLRSRFPLTSQPVVSTIAVRVNGQPVPRVSAGGMTAWAHDGPTNSVNFVGSAVPQANQTIEVTYTVACLP